MDSSRPSHIRKVSTTNLPKGSGHRPLEGKLAVITGASQGIGSAIAENLASKGASLVLNYASDKSAEQTEKLSAELQEIYGVACCVVQADMGGPTGPTHIINGAKNNFSHPKTGKFQIDIVVNNAGVSKDARLADVQISDFEWCYRINVLGPLLLMQASLPYLPQDRSGRIVNVSSVSSSEGFVGHSIYGGTKAALEAMTRTWACELVERATVNAINPGPVKTDMWANTTAQFKESMQPFVKRAPLKAMRPEIDDEDVVKDADILGDRSAYPSEVAGIVSMLCSEDSGFCTGQVVCANGGMRMVI